MSRLFILLILIFQLTSPVVHAQEALPAPSGTRKQMATIVFSGLAGAVLGLSTLSFYGRPQDRLSNIAIGFALGIVTGAVLVTYGATTDPDQFYGRELSTVGLDYLTTPQSEHFHSFSKGLRTSSLELKLPLYQLRF